MPPPPSFLLESAYLAIFEAKSSKRGGGSRARGAAGERMLQERDECFVSGLGP